MERYLRIHFARAFLIILICKNAFAVKASEKLFQYNIKNSRS